MNGRKDSAYTNGVIAVKEKKLLKEKLVRMCSMSEEEALRLLLDSGFGGEYSEPEELILADEREIDLFVREYCPSKEAEEYLLAPRDFHNAKALMKARHLGCDPTPLLGSNGKFTSDEIAKCIEAGDTAKLNKELHEAVQEASALLEGTPSGAEVGFVFDRALFRYLDRVLKKFGVCRKLLVRRVDMLNLLTYFRSESKEEAEKYYLSGGSLTKTKLACVFAGLDEVKKVFDKGEYREFVKKLVAAREGEKPFTEAEKMLESFETDFFSEKPHELTGQGVFLHYIFRRRAENANVRIVFVCLKAGLSEAEIKKRLRGSV